jgi:uncharacterized membrane protein
MKRIITYLSISFLIHALCLIFTKIAFAQSNYSRADGSGIVGTIGLFLIIAIFYVIKALFRGSKQAITKISESIKDKKQKSKCPYCEKLYFIAENQIGKETTCENCHNKFIIKEYIVLKTAD